MTLKESKYFLKSKKYILDYTGLKVLNGTVLMTWRKYHVSNNITQTIFGGENTMNIENPCWPGKMSRAALFVDILVNPYHPNCGLSLEMKDGTYLTPFKHAIHK